MAVVAIHSGKSHLRMTPVRSSGLGSSSEFRRVSTASMVQWPRKRREFTCASGRMMFYRLSLKFWDSAKQPQELGKSAAFLLMLFLWLGTLAAAVSPALHQLLHADAKNPGHSCAVTELSGGSVLSGAVPAAVPCPPVFFAELSAASESQNYCSFDLRLSPSRAPPSASKIV